MRTLVLTFREAAASARSQPVASALTVIMVAGMCVAVLLTTGRTVAAEDAVLAEIDAAGTRSIIVRADTQAGLTAGIIDQLRRVAAVESATGFGPITDVRNSRVPDGPPVPMRQAHGQFGEAMLVRTPLDGMAVVTPGALNKLGLVDGTGAVTTTNGTEYTVGGTFDPPEHLAFLDPMVLIPSPNADGGNRDDPDAPLSLLVVQADRPEHVTVVTDVVVGLLIDADPQDVSIETSQQLADIRSAISGELGTYGRATVLGILAVSVVLVAVNLFGLVTLRRKDFGRRRALGATQPLIIALLLTQVTILAAIGAAAGTGGTIAWLAANDQSLPDVDFNLAVGISAVLTALIAALAPAAMAARRDPLHELRVP